MVIIIVTIIIISFIIVTIIIIIIACVLLLQKPLILEVKGIKIGFLGYCNTSAIGLNCTEIRKLFNAGPAVYSDVIATRDVSNLKKVFTLLFYKLVKKFTVLERHLIAKQNRDEI